MRGVGFDWDFDGGADGRGQREVISGRRGVVVGICHVLIEGRSGHASVNDDLRFIWVNHRDFEGAQRGIVISSSVDRGVTDGQD